MKILFTVFGILLFFAATILITAYICFRMAFYVDRRKETNILSGDVYKPFKELFAKWTKETDTLPFTDFSITSFDGLMLKGKYYECKRGAPIEIMFHGYRGNAKRDLCGGVQRCFALGRNALIVDQRACGESEGNIISFGVNESKDCLLWIDFVINHFGSDVKIILTGISMGAATVIMAAGKPLPKNVIGVLADCGYTSAEDIIKIVIKQMKLPPTLAYPFVKLGAKIFGRFDLSETPPIKALESCRLPVIFFHGEKDGFVPCDMSRRNFDAYKGEKMLITVPDADHGLSYPVDPEKYLKALKDFFVEKI